MSIFGVLLLTAILCIFAILLLAEKIHKKVISTSFIPTNISTKIQEICIYLTQTNIKEQAGYLSLLFGIWNLFGPNFGSLYGGIPILGALIPSLVLCFDSFILNPELLNWIPLAPFKQKLETHISQYSPIAGWITLGVAVLHSLLYRLPFF